MLRLNSRKIIAYLLVFVLASMSLSACNKDGADPASDASQDGQVSDNAALENAIAEALNESEKMAGENENGDTTGDNPDNSGDNQPADQSAPTEPVDSAPAKAVADRSPVEITRIEVPDDTPAETNNSFSSGSLANKDEDDHKHEVTPNLFPVEKCLVEVNGIYQVKLSKDLLKEVNKRRADRKISALTENTSLDACADARCKEQTYFVGHFRPDGTAFDSVGRGYVQGECIAVDYRTVNDIMEAWFAVNESRYQIMNPDYTQVGISIYDIDGIYYIAAVFGY